MNYILVCLCSKHDDAVEAKLCPKWRHDPAAFGVYDLVSSASEAREALMSRCNKNRPTSKLAILKTAKSVSLWVADRYRKGCPDNAAGQRIGFGLSSADAVKACEPWSNQAPWFIDRARHLATFTDGEPLLTHQREALDKLLDYFPFEEISEDYLTKPASALLKLFKKEKKSWEV